MSFTTVTVNGTLLNPLNAPVIGGQITFTLSQPISDGGANYVGSEPISVLSGGSGTFTATLLANDDSTTMPTGTYYTVNVNTPWGNQTFDIVVSKAYAPVVNLFSLPQVMPSTASPTAVPFVSELVAGSNITLSPSSGTGQVTVSASGGGSNLVIDTTAGDFQPDGTASAGSTGKIADAGHVHPASSPILVINPASATQALTLPRATGASFDITLSQNTTLSAPTGAVSSTFCYIQARITQNVTGGWTLGFGWSILWQNSQAPTMPAGAGQRLELAFWSWDGGTTWEGAYQVVFQEWRKDISPFLGFVVNAGSWGGVTNASAIGNGLFYNSSATINDSVSWVFGCEGGTWTLNLMYFKASAYGQVTWYIDGVSIGTTDQYNASSTYNNIASFTNIALSAGKHTLTATVTGKNASSSGYDGTVAAINLQRTA